MYNHAHTYLWRARIWIYISRGHQMLQCLEYYYRIFQVPISQEQSVFDAFIMSCNSASGNSILFKVVQYWQYCTLLGNYACKGTNLFWIEQMKIAFGAIFGHSSWESIKVSRSRAAYLSALNSLILFGKGPCNRRLTVGQPSGDCRERQGNGRWEFGKLVDRNVKSPTRRAREILINLNWLTLFVRSTP